MFTIKNNKFSILCTKEKRRYTTVSKKETVFMGGEVLWVERSGLLLTLGVKDDPGFSSAVWDFGGLYGLYPVVPCSRTKRSDLGR